MSESRPTELGEVYTRTPAIVPTADVIAETCFMASRANEDLEVLIFILSCLSPRRDKSPSHLRGLSQQRRRSSGTDTSKDNSLWPSQATSSDAGGRLYIYPDHPYIYPRVSPYTHNKGREQGGGAEEDHRAHHSAYYMGINDANQRSSSDAFLRHSRFKLSMLMAARSPEPSVWHR